MKQFSFACCLVIPLTWALGGWSEAGLDFAPAAPSFGTVATAFGADPVISVAVRNDDSEPMRIDRVTMGCGCISAGWDRAVVLPAGKSVEVQLTLRRADIKKGQHSYPLTAYSGDRVVGVLPVRYEFAPEIDCVPREVDIDSDQRSGRESNVLAEARVELAPTLSKRELKLSCPAGGISATLAATDDPNSRIVRVSVAQTRLYETFETKVQISDAASGVILMELPIRVYSRGACEAIPRAILLGRIPLGTTSTRQVSIRGIPPFTITSVRSSDPCVVPKHDESGTGSDISVSITASKNGFLHATLEIEVDGIKHVHLSIPVVAEVIHATR